MIKKAMSDEYNAYHAINSRKEKYGVYFKTCFHVHTPESYDYTLLSDWNKNNYFDSTDKEIFDICINRRVFTSLSKIDDFEPIGQFSEFSSRKEVMSFLLLAEELIVKEIEVVVVADHNTIMGVTKLKKAISILCSLKRRRTYPEVILGIEISCADKKHVVGIFDDTIDNTLSINKWLKNNLLNDEEGSYETSMRVLQYINSIGGIGYIAHIDTSETFDANYLSSAYRHKLYSDEISNFVGLSDFGRLIYIKSKLTKYRSEEIKFFIDNDAHDLESIDKKFFWIKGRKRNFSMIKEAIYDYDVSISFTEQKYNRQYIKGIFIEKSKDGFLKGNDGKGAFCLNFSDALNCIIGGVVPARVVYLKYWSMF